MPKTIAILIREHFESLSPTERKVGRILLKQYPILGLETIAQIANKASVSGPTVLRFVNKIGFESFGAFQERLRDELETQLQSPILRRDPNPDTQDLGFFDDFTQSMTKLMLQTSNNLIKEDFDSTVALLSKPNCKVWLIGGHITGSLAEYFCSHLQSIRGQVALLRPRPDIWADTLIDMDKRDIIVVFDVRRYWSQLETMIQLAKQQKTKVILITDQWVSPLTLHADITLTAYTQGKSGWDANVSVMLLVDALIAGINNLTWETSTKQRLQRIEELRNELRD